VTALAVIAALALAALIALALLLDPPAGGLRRVADADFLADFGTDDEPAPAEAAPPADCPDWCAEQPGHYTACHTVVGVHHCEHAWMEVELARPPGRETVGDQAVDQWDNQLGGKIFEQLLTANGGKVDGVLAANDGLAGAVITVLKKNGLAGAVPVTGQDATPEGLAAILRGEQCMTVYKPVHEEAKAAAELAIALAKGDTATADRLASATERDPKGNRDVKSVLLTPQVITKDNVKKVVDDGFVKAADLCKGDVAPLCAEAGIQ